MVRGGDAACGHGAEDEYHGTVALGHLGREVHGAVKGALVGKSCRIGERMKTIGISKHWRLPKHTAPAGRCRERGFFTTFSNVSFPSTDRIFNLCSNCTIRPENLLKVRGILVFALTSTSTFFSVCTKTLTLPALFKGLLNIFRIKGIIDLCLS